MKAPMKTRKTKSLPSGEVLHVVGRDGFTLCCRAMTTIDQDTAEEYCKGCFEPVTNPGPKMRVVIR